MSDSHKIKLPFATSHAFVVGINDYRHVSPLKTAVNDATQLAKKLSEDHGYQVYPPLLNATKKEMEELIQEKMLEIVGPEDRVLFYFAGHGIALNSDDKPQGYFVPADADGENPDSLVSMDILHDIIDKLPCKHGLLIMDCCFAGSFKWSTGMRQLLFDLPAIIYEERFYQYAQDPAWQVITSSASDQKAVDILSNRTLGLRNEDDADHSPFAQALLDALDGEADTVPKEKGDGVITTTELYTYLRDRVENETRAEGLRQSPSMFPLHKHDKGQYIFMHPRHPQNLPPIPRRNPFMGLKSYNEKDNQLFFGRDRVIEALDALCDQNQMVVVSGVSGTGKSSVIKAGLLPLLRKKGWQILPTIRPGKEPLWSLRGEISDLPAMMNAEVENLLIVDQYEELITQCLHPEDRISFEEQLKSWLEQHTNLHIIISIRSDFEPQFEDGILADWWQGGHYIVPTFNPDELREVIIKPTIQEVLFFEPDTLVDKLVDAVNQAPGALPLLSFTLSELYHAYVNSGRTNRALALEDYDKLGGVIGALRTRANTIYDELDEASQDSMRKLMLRMVSLEGGELASRRVLSEDLIFTDEAETARIEALAQQLVTSRLVATGRDKEERIYYEPAHDALVRAWARLWEWIKAMGEGKMGLMYKLSLAVADYEAHKDSSQAKEYLWSDDPYLDLLAVDLEAGSHPFNAKEESFLRESLRIRKRDARRRRMIVGAVMIVLIGISSVALWEGQRATQEANRANKEAERAQDSAEVAIAQREIALIKSQEALDSARVARIQRSKADSAADVAMYERDQADQARRVAEAQTREAQALAIATLAQTLPDQDNIPAFQLLKMAYDKTRPKEPPPMVQRTLANLFYDRIGENKMLRRSLYTAAFEGHSGYIRSAVFSPDGKYILTASNDKTAKLWDLKGNEMISFRGHTDMVISALFSPDGNYVLSISKDKTARIWNRSGQEVARLNGHTASVYAADFSPNGKYILTGSWDNTARLWDLKGNEIARCVGHQDNIIGSAFSPDGKLLLTSSWDGTARLWDLTGKQVRLFQSPDFKISSASFSPDGQSILTTCRDKNTRLWDLEGRQLAVFRGHRGNIITARFSPDGKTVLTAASEGGSTEKAAKLWDLQGRELATCSGHTEAINTASFSPDGKYILTGSKDYTARIWDLKGNEITSCKGHSNQVIDAVFSPDGKSMLTASMDNTAKLWKLESTETLKINLSPGLAQDATYSPDGQYIMTMAYGKPARLWNRQGELVAQYLKNEKAIGRPSFSPDGKSILIAYDNHSVIYWNRNGQQLANCEGHTDQIRSVVFSPNGKYILTASSDKTARLWNLQGEVLARCTGHLESLNSAEFSPNGKTILTSSSDNTARLWDLKGKEIISFKGHQEAVRTASFSPDGRSILTASSDNTAKRWNLQGKEVTSYVGHEKGISSAIFSPNGKYILTASGDETARIWDLQGRELARCEGHISYVSDIAFSPDGRYILTASSNPSKENAFRLWDLQGNEIAFCDHHTKQVSSAVFSPDGKYVLTASFDKTVRIWPTPDRIHEYISEENSLPELTQAEKEAYGIK